MKLNGKIGFASQERQIGKGKMLKLKTGVTVIPTSPVFGTPVRDILG